MKTRTHLLVLGTISLVAGIVYEITGRDSDTLLIMAVIFSVGYHISNQIEKLER